MTSTASLSHMLLGALVADAATLGLHWIYEPNRIRDIANANGGSAAFIPINDQNYANTKGYFAHASRKDGMLTQYGEYLYLAIHSINTSDGVFDVTAHQTEFLEHFGPGGAYRGYIDRPTRGTLNNIANEMRSPSGIDDDQLPSVSRLPAIVAGYIKSSDLEAQAKAAMEMTNVNEIAAEYTSVFLSLFQHLHDGMPLLEAMRASIDHASATTAKLLEDALTTLETSSVDYGEKTGRACHLPMAGPLIFHILKHSTSYREAVERNLAAGGDNAGRSILIGAIMGYLHGLEPQKGIPLDWILKMDQNHDIWAACQTLTNAKS